MNLHIHEQKCVCWSVFSCFAQGTTVKFSERTQNCTHHWDQMIRWMQEQTLDQSAKALGNQFLHWYHDWLLPLTGGEHGCFIWTSSFSWWDWALALKAVWLICGMTLGFHLKRVYRFEACITENRPWMRHFLSHQRSFGGTGDVCLSTQLYAPGASLIQSYTCRIRADGLGGGYCNTKY